MPTPQNTPRKVIFGQDKVKLISNNAYNAMDVTNLYDSINSLLEGNLKQATLDFVNNKKGQPDLSWYEFGEILDRIFTNKKIAQVIGTSKLNELTFKNLLIGHLLAFGEKPFKHILSHYVRSEKPNDVQFDFTIVCFLIILNPTFHLHCKAFNRYSKNANVAQVCKQIENLVKNAYTLDNGWNEAFFELFKNHYEIAYGCPFPSQATTTGGKKQRKSARK